MQVVVKVAVAVTLLGAAAFFVYRSMAPGADEAAGPGDTRWLCTAAGCGKDFSLSFAALNEFYQKNPSAEPPCPACGTSGAVRAAACPSCGKTVPKLDRLARAAAKTPVVCPHCKKPV